MNSRSSIGISGRSQYNGYVATRPAVIGIAKVLVLGLTQASTAAAAPVLQLLGNHKHEHPDAEDASLWLYLSFAAVLVLLGGAFAGLTIAYVFNPTPMYHTDFRRLMGQDGVYLQVIATSGEGKEQRHAQKVYRLLQKGKHWVLVTLLLSNVIVNETLPIILDRSLGGGWPAVLGSTALIGRYILELSELC
jgi:metal transporter CNNM